MIPKPGLTPWGAFRFPVYRLHLQMTSGRKKKAVALAAPEIPAIQPEGAAGGTLLPNERRDAKARRICIRYTAKAPLPAGGDARRYCRNFTGAQAPLPTGEVHGDIAGTSPGPSAPKPGQRGG